MALSDHVEIFADGACSGNPGPGGWGAILRFKGVEKELSGHAPHTTNNRMELLGVIEAFRALKKPCTVAVYTDSTYVQKGMSEWIGGWKAKKWLRAGKPIPNADLWQVLDGLASEHRVSWHWVRGHDGHPENERCDALARAAIKAAPLSLSSGSPPSP